MLMSLRQGSASTTLILGLAAVPAFAQAQDAPDTPPPEAAAPVYSIWGFDLTGHFDVAYTHLSGSGKFVSGVNDRVFDFKRNDAIFHALDLNFARTPMVGWGGVLDLTIGKDADTIAAYGTIDKDKGPANGADHYVDPTQVYVYYGAGPLNVIAGKYVTLAGAEVIKSNSDFQYSRSILFGYAIPFSHTGVRATAKVSDTVSLIGGLNQGWDVVQDPNSDKTVELGVAFAPTPAATLTASYYGGKEHVTNYPKSDANGNRNLLDVLGTFKLTDRLTLIGNYDYGTQERGGSDGGKAKWQGFAGYANYQLGEQWRLSARAEYFDDRDGYRTGVAQKWKEATLTLAYLPSKPWEIRAEVRGDRSDERAFLDSDGLTPTKSQRSFGLEMLYVF